MISFFQDPSWARLVVSLVHTLWQGAAAAVLVFLCLKAIPARRFELRYAISLGGLAVVLCAWLVTWSWLDHDSIASSASEPAALAERISQSSGLKQSAGTSATPGSSQSTVYSIPLEEGRSRIVPLVSAQAKSGIASWSAPIAIAWMIIAALFQFRLVLSVSGAAGLREQSRPVQDRQTLSCFEAIGKALKLKTPVALLESASVTVPSVLGLLKPAVLVPAGWLAGTSPHVIEAVLAHELAHIRRHDYFINLGQLMVEGLFFFNPFVWWLSRAIRAEREACCDAEAAQLLGQRVSYAHALADFAEQNAVSDGVTSAVLAIDGREPTLVERVRRLLDPGIRPMLRLPIRSLVLFVATATFALSGLKFTAVKAIDVLTPEQRLQRLSEVGRQYPDPEVQRITSRNDEREKITISGTVRTFDGRALPGPTVIHISANGLSASVSVNKKTGRFEYRVPAGLVSIAATSEGYAPAVLDSIRAESDIDGIKLELQKGFPVSFRFTDPNGNPLQAVTVKGGYEHHGSVPHTIHEKSDSKGLVTLENVGESKLKLEALLPGFQPANKTLELSETAVVNWELAPAERTTGRVVLQHDATPVPDAKIHLTQAFGIETRGFGEPSELNLVTETDGEGRFEIDTLRNDSEYYVSVVGPGLSGSVEGPLRSGRKDLTLEVPAARYLNLVITNVEPKHLNNRGELGANYAYTISFRDAELTESLHAHTHADGYVAEPIDGVAKFRIGPLWRAKTEVSVAHRSFEFTWEQVASRTEPLVVDLAEPSPSESEAPKRTILIKLNVPENHPPANGSLIVGFVKNGIVEGRSRSWDERLLKLTNGVAETVIPTPNQIEVKMTTSVGYWFPPNRHFDVATAGDPFVIQMNAIPAGAIYGRVLEENGEPATGIMVSVFPTVRSPLTKNALLGVDVKSSTSSSDPENRFMAGPLPLDGTYVICAHRGASYVLSEPLLVDAANPLHEIRLIIPKGVNVTGRVTGPDGAPWPGEPIHFSFSAHESHGFSSTPTRTDADGNFTIPAVNPSVNGPYRIEIRSRKQVQPYQTEGAPGRDVRIQLKNGSVIEGMVTEAKSGWVIPGAEVYAQRVDEQSQEVHWPVFYDAERLSDEHGRFRFSNLAPGTYKLGSRSGRLVGGGDSVRTGEKSAVIEIEPYIWSKLIATPLARANK